MESLRTGAKKRRILFTRTAAKPGREQEAEATGWRVIGDEESIAG